ncbi:hypothetical protein BOTBODRAFT_64769 [Botryobasidium botryosum FD-172 SS1]|uniref:Myb-like domain-containing protein n=1 Tax=Botryobasidium botryosum (strain FD-172 SS1) TaxID=930990 RepID=A0A067MX40_BOTB1|nr:hypothetical protein BOTBODRAFT_64769 [Botryobasidium botryosum FD-172 SS1]
MTRFDVPSPMRKSSCFRVFCISASAPGSEKPVFMSPDMRLFLSSFVYTSLFHILSSITALGPIMKHWPTNEIDSSGGATDSPPYLSTRSGKRRRLAISAPAPVKPMNRSRSPLVTSMREIGLPYTMPATRSSPPPPLYTRTRLSLRSAAMSAHPYRGLLDHNRISSKLSVRERVAHLNARDNASRSSTPTPPVQSRIPKPASGKDSTISHRAFLPLTLHVNATSTDTSPVSSFTRAGAKRKSDSSPSSSPVQPNKRVRFTERADDSLRPTESILSKATVEMQKDDKDISIRTPALRAASDPPAGVTRRSQRNLPSSTLKHRLDAPALRRSPRLNKSLRTSTPPSQVKLASPTLYNQERSVERSNLPHRMTTRALSAAPVAPKATMQQLSHKKHRWSPAEDKILIDIILSVIGPLPWAQITSEMAKQSGGMTRTQGAIQYRWRILKPRIHQNKK